MIDWIRLLAVIELALHRRPGAARLPFDCYCAVCVALRAATE